MLEIFMPKYTVKVYGENIINREDSLSKPINLSFPVEANTIEKAAVGTVEELEIIGFKSKYHTWNAKIIGPNGENYKILKQGKWLINTNTGEKVNPLEGKLD